MDLKRRLIGWGLDIFGATGVHRLAAPFTRGPGAVLMLHRVADDAPLVAGYDPNKGLTVSPSFLDAALTRVRALGFEIVGMDAVAARLREGADLDAPFVAVTFDDGYRDTLRAAAPILRRHGAPYTVYVTPGFADRTARMWWVELEEAVRRLSHIETTIAGEALSLPARDGAEKTDAFFAIYWRLRALPEPALLDEVAKLADVAGYDPLASAATLCCDWSELAELAADPLCTIGAHTMTHPRLATLPETEARAEMAGSRDAIRARLGVETRHFAYPVGDPTSASRRDFEIAKALGFETGVTTRPGMLFPEHGGDLLALPRVSVNGGWQRLEVLDILLSGAAFALWNRGKRLAA